MNGMAVVDGRATGGVLEHVDVRGVTLSDRMWTGSACDVAV
jgi:hypothetical protein